MEPEQARTIGAISYERRNITHSNHTRWPLIDLRANQEKCLERTIDQQWNQPGEQFDPYRLAHSRCSERECDGLAASSTTTTTTTHRTSVYDTRW